MGLTVHSKYPFLKFTELISLYIFQGNIDSLTHISIKKSRSAENSDDESPRDEGQEGSGNLDMSCENIEQDSPPHRQPQYITGVHSNATLQYDNPYSVLNTKTGHQMSTKSNTNSSLRESPGSNFVECSCTSPAEDQYSEFGRYVGVEMRNIGDSQLERDAKRQILHLLFEAQSKVVKHKKLN